MSALDMVLQRQVPARPAGKAGDGFSGGDTVGASRNDTFSAALSQEKRSSAPEREKVQSGNEVDTGDEAANSEEQLSTRSGQSDDILNLLSGLKSSASYADDAELGAVDVQEDLTAEVPLKTAPEAAAQDGEAATTLDSETAAAPDGEAAEVTVDEVDEESALALAKEAPAVATPGMPVPGNENPAKVVAKPDGANVARNTPDQVSAGTAAANTAAAAQASTTKAAQTPADAKTAAATPTAQVAASGIAGQGAAAQPKATGTPTATDPQKDPSSVREAMRALGLGGEPVPANVDAAKARARNAGKQEGADDKRIDDLASKKDGKVEVLESRRFMPAQNLTANAQMLTRSLADAGASALAAQRAAPAQPLAQTGLPQAGQTLHTLKLQLNPISLGSVTAVLKLSGEDLSVEIKVQTAEAYRQLKDDNQAILKALRGQGFGVEQITVQHVVGTDRASNQTAQPGFQSSQQGPGSNDAQSSGKDGNRNNTGQQDSGSRGGQSHEQGSYAGSGAGRTDGVYL